MLKNNIKNTKDLLKTLKNQRREFVLDKEKKESNKEELISFMKEHPVRNENMERRELRSSFSAGMMQRLFTQFNFSHKPMAVILTIAIVATLGGGATLAAQDSLPGDVLYPVKVGVNERVESALAFSEDAEMELALKHTERRFHEMGTLIAEERLSEKASAQLEHRLSLHIDKASRLSAKFEERSDSAKTAELNARLEALFETHSNILTEIEKDADENLGRQIARINAQAKNESTTTAEAGARAEASVRSEANAEGRKQATESLMKAAERNLDNAKKFADRLAASGRTEVSAEAEHHLNASQELIVEGKAQIESKDYGEAFTAFQNALRHAQRAHSLIASSVSIEAGARGRIELDVQNNGQGNDAQNNARENGARTNIDTKTETEIEATSSSSLIDVKFDGNINTKGRANVRGSF